MNRFTAYELVKVRCTRKSVAQDVVTDVSDDVAASFVSCDGYRLSAPNEKCWR